MKVTRNRNVAGYSPFNPPLRPSTRRVSRSLRRMSELTSEQTHEPGRSGSLLVRDSERLGRRSESLYGDSERCSESLRVAIKGLGCVSGRAETHERAELRGDSKKTPVVMTRMMTTRTMIRMAFTLRLPDGQT